MLDPSESSFMTIVSLAQNNHLNDVLTVNILLVTFVWHNSFYIKNGNNCFQNNLFILRSKWIALDIMIIQKNSPSFNKLKVINLSLISSNKLLMLVYLVRSNKVGLNILRLTSIKDALGSYRQCSLLKSIVVVLCHP